MDTNADLSVLQQELCNFDMTIFPMDKSQQQNLLFELYLISTITTTTLSNENEMTTN